MNPSAVILLITLGYVIGFVIGYHTRGKWDKETAEHIAKMKQQWDKYFDDEINRLSKKLDELGK